MSKQRRVRRHRPSAREHGCGSLDSLDRRLLLETVEVFDEYRGKNFAGRSVAWRLVFRAPDRTLKDREVDKAVNRALKQLKEEFGVERRQA